MLETKDYWTIGASTAAILVSLGALTVSFLSYRLAIRKDQRDIEAKKPLVEIDPPACDGLGTWIFPVKITNRDEAPIHVERLISDENRIVSMTFSSNYVVSLADLTDPNLLNFVTLQARVPIAGTINFDAEVQPYRGRRVPSEAEAIFALEYRRTIGNTARQRLPVRIILNP